MLQIIHFGYHKCLTVYYMRVMQQLSTKIGFFYAHYEHDYQKLLTDYAKPQSSINVYGASSNIYDKLDIKDIRGSHFIRNPLDMLVSAYFYHKKCDEDWCISVQPEQRWILKVPHYYDFFENSGSFPEKISYQQYLNSLSFEDGITLEMLRSYPIFKSMYTWDFNNPNIIEFRYEDIIGNEVEVFEKLFKHYGFGQKITEEGKKIAQNFSLEKRKKMNDNHVRSGNLNQWKEYFTPELKRRFNLIYPDLVMKTGYSSEEWAL